MIELPDIKPGLSVMSSDTNRIINVHSVRDDQVFYGVYDKDGEPIKLRRQSVESFTDTLPDIMAAGHGLFTLISRDAPQQPTTEGEGDHHG